MFNALLTFNSTPQSRENATQRFERLRKLVLFVAFAISFGGFQKLFSQDYQLDFTPKSPEASAFNKYGDIGVNLFTGSPNISFPISASEEVPISIGYNASGIKPEEHSGWLGSNWNLNAGGG